jgi:membrane fusion protein, multidrug efflux system
MKSFLKKNGKWLLVLLVLIAAGGFAMRTVSARKADAAKAAAAKPETILELAASDIAVAQVRELSEGLPISGSLKAANSALVKARVPGELQGLTVREGDNVKAGQIIARVDSSEYQSRVTQAQRSADAAKAQVDIAQRSYDNNKALVNQGFISPTALETSAASLAGAKSTFASAVAAVDVARKSLDDTVLKAPISGIISQRSAQPGERVGIDARVVEIIDISRLELEAAMAASDSVDVQVGQQATLRFEGRTEIVPAVITRINPSAVAGSRSVLVYLSVAKTAGLRQGLFAQGTLGTAKVQTLSVPLAAVRSDKPVPYVQVVKDGAIIHQSIELGAQGDAQGTTMVAVKNISAGTQVTLASAGFIREGSKIKVGATATVAAPQAPQALQVPALPASPATAASAAN